MTDRKLARVVVIDDIIEHPNADALELAIVGGWQCVVKKGEYKPFDVAIYIEVDAAVPLDNPNFAFLEGKNNVTIDDKKYARIKTIKLRKELSQGLIIPTFNTVHEGKDMTEELGIVKYEKPAERQSISGNGSVKSSRPFPDFIPKTDQERVQNITRKYLQAVDSGELFEKSYKLDGSSLTAWVKDGEPGVASRNVAFNPYAIKYTFIDAVRNYMSDVLEKGWKKAKWIREIPEDKNAFTDMAKESSVLTALMSEYNTTGGNYAIQGEMVGPSIQKNFEGVKQNEFFVYDMYDITHQRYLLPAERRHFCNRWGLNHVPVAWNEQPLLLTVAEAITDADGPSGLNGKYREGFVYKSTIRDFSFKVISNKYLMKED